MSLPLLFVASATEDLNVARNVQALLDHDAEVEVWTEGTFVPSGFALTSLWNAPPRSGSTSRSS